MMESLASRAPTSPPDTGASRQATPFLDPAAAICTAKAGLEVVISMAIVPFFAFAKMPCGPK